LDGRFVLICRHFGTFRTRSVSVSLIVRSGQQCRPDNVIPFERGKHRESPIAWRRDDVETISEIIGERDYLSDNNLSENVWEGGADNVEERYPLSRVKFGAVVSCKIAHSAIAAGFLRRINPIGLAADSSLIHVTSVDDRIVAPRAG